MRRALVVFAVLAAAVSCDDLVLGPAWAAEAPKDRVVVMYFHRTERCPTCLTMGSYTEEAVLAGFAPEIKTGKVSFHYIDFQDPKNAAFTQAYRIAGPTLIVAKASGPKVVEYKNLEEMWTKVRDKNQFLDYVRGNVRAYLAPRPAPGQKPSR